MSEFILALALVMLVVWLIIDNRPRQSQIYRGRITDLYVAGMIRKFALKDDVDLEQEEKNFLLHTKTSAKKQLADLDDKLEYDLAERIEKSFSNKDSSKTS